LRVHTVLTNNEGKERIVHVPIPAQAGYAANALSLKAVRNLNAYSMPGFNLNEGSYRSFEVKGDSMYPSIEATDILICEFLDPSDWAAGLKDEEPYVVVTNSDVLVKRVMNRLRVDGLLQLHSDNEEYRPFLVHEEEIREIWKPKYTLKRFIKQMTGNSQEIERNEIDLREVLANQQRILVDVQRQMRDLMNQRNNSK
jgi:phage repressor protein C with HTH and peptisase S24 domain